MRAGGSVWGVVGWGWVRGGSVCGWGWGVVSVPRLGSGGSGGVGLRVGSGAMPAMGMEVRWGRPKGTVGWELRQGGGGRGKVAAPPTPEEMNTYTGKHQELNSAGMVWRRNGE